MSAQTILLVDDDEAAIGLIEAILEPMDEWTLVIARNGSEAISMASAERPNVVLLDRMLPDADGINLCKQITSDPTMASTKVIMLTGMDDGATQTAAIAAGATSLLTKPFSTVALIEMIESAVS